MARYLRTTKCRQTRRPVTTGHGADLGLDTVGEGPWYTICDDHAELCSHITLADAQAWAAEPTMWCSQCQADHHFPR
jgi:hypothetical protein